LGSKKVNFSIIKAKFRIKWANLKVRRAKFRIK
jgi:hypothetical protein